MPVKHEAREEFVERLEWQLAAELRRRGSIPGRPGWTWLTPTRAVAAIAAIVIVSMAAGGAVVAAAYRSQANERREQVASVYARRVDLARQRLVIEEDRLTSSKRRVSIGVATNRELLESQFKVVEAQAELKSAELQLEEVKLTGLEPVSVVSAPLVRARDFVSERWQIEMTVPQMALDMEKRKLADAQRRVEIGVADPVEVDIARTQTMEAELALQGFQRKLDIRRRFLKKEFDATQADLRVLEVEADMRCRSLQPRLELAKREVERSASRVQKGLAQNLELAEANLRRADLESQLLKAQLDLEVIRRRLAGK